MINCIGMIHFEFTQRILRIFGTKDEPLFLAREVGNILGLTNIHNNISKMDDDEKKLLRVQTSTGVRKMVFIKESALFKLLMRSNRREAVQFQGWICEEVLPTIRRTGRYDYCKTNTIMEQLQEELN